MSKQKNDKTSIDEEKSAIGFSKTSDDIAEQYDHYYARADSTNPLSSVYNRRFGENRVLVREKELIRDSVFRVISRLPTPTEESPLSLRLIDFGAGDGRLFSIFQELAEELKERHIEIELLAVEPSFQGISNFQADCSSQGFVFLGENRLHPIAKDISGANGYNAGTMRKDNLAVTFIHNHVEDHMEHTAALVGDVHFTMAMFGVLAHVPTKIKRQAYMSMLYEQTSPSGEILVNVPTPLMFLEEQNAYNLLRKQKRSLGLANEKRDIYYCKFAKEIEDGSEESPTVDNYYHIFSAKELWKLVAGAGFQIYENVIASSIEHPSDLSQNPERNEADARQSAKLSNDFSFVQTLAKNRIPSTKIEGYCHYMGIVGIKNEREQLSSHK